MESTPVGTANGYVRWCISKTPASTAYWCDDVDYTDIVTTASELNRLSYLKLGYDLANGGDTAQSWFDDIYIDDSWARVEIGDENVYANCTVREMIIPSAWSATEITATVKQGTFAADEVAYLYVTDSDGVTSDAYEITFGSTATTLTTPIAAGTTPIAAGTTPIVTE